MSIQRLKETFKLLFCTCMKSVVDFTINMYCFSQQWLDWHHSAHVLLAGTASGDVWMWKVPGGDCKTLQNHGSKTTCGMFMKDGMD